MPQDNRAAAPDAADGAPEALRAFGGAATAHLSLTGETVCLTGATGCLGSSLIPYIAACGGAVRALVRPGGEQRVVPAPGVTIHGGNVLDRGYLTRALGDASAVVHLAGLVHADERRYSWNDFLAANV